MRNALATTASFPAALQVTLYAASERPVMKGGAADS